MKSNIDYQTNRSSACSYVDAKLSRADARATAMATTLRAIAEALNARGIPTARGGEWHAMTVRNVLARV
jgi:hypothetical protein